MDYFRDYPDCANVYSETQRLKIYDELQAHIDALHAQGVSLRYAERELQVTWGSDQPEGKPAQVIALYVMAFPLGKESAQFVMRDLSRAQSIAPSAITYQPCSRIMIAIEPTAALRKSRLLWCSNHPHR